MLDLNEEIERYTKARPVTLEYWQKAKHALAGGISHNIRTFGLTSAGTFPIFLKSANGAFIKDLDDNEYIDGWNGHYAMILGHSHPEVLQSLKDNVGNGWLFGTITNFQVDLASRLIKDNRAIEKVRFCTSGTEATMYASRLARAFTKRTVIAKTRHGWHGANDTLSYEVGGEFLDNVSPGLMPQHQAGVLTFNINNEEVFDLINLNKHTLAAIIIEPVLGGGGGFAVDLEYLKRLREETERHNILLIFDEIITGYRFTDKLYQEVLKVYPDLTTMGKVIGGGFPIGGIGGREEIINQAAPGVKSQVLIGGGTFSGFPLSMIAGLKTIKILSREKDKLEAINNAGMRLKNELNEYFYQNDIPIFAAGEKSVIKLHTLTKPMINPSRLDVETYGDDTTEPTLQLALYNRGFAPYKGLGNLTLAHSSAEINKIKQLICDVSSLIYS